MFLGVKFEKKLNNTIKLHFFGLKFTFKTKKLSEKEIIELNKSYEENNSNNEYPHIHNKDFTLNTLIETENSIVRYGDGEFNIMLKHDIPFQKYSPELAQRLKEIIVSQNKNILVGLPNTFGSLSQYSTFAKNFWRKYLAYNRKQVYSLLDFNKQYVDTQVSRPYMDAEDKSFCEHYFKDFKKVWDKKNIIFVEGECSRLGLGNNLFDNANSIKRILCPQKNAFDKYDEILEYCKKQPKDTLFILALGPTATVLAYDLHQAGFRALDLGHIDIEYEWFLLKATTKIAIENKYVNEANDGRKITTVSDKQYADEIIMNFAK